MKNRLLTNVRAAEYNKSNDKEGGLDNVFRRDTNDRLNEDGRVLRSGNNAGDSRENQGENTESARREQGLHREISNPIYAAMRLEFLAESENQEQWELLTDLYYEKKLVPHLMETQERAIRMDEGRETENDGSLGLEGGDEDRKATGIRGANEQSDFELEGDHHQGSSRSLENQEGNEGEGSRTIGFFFFFIQKIIPMN